MRKFIVSFITGMALLFNSAVVMAEKHDPAIFNKEQLSSGVIKVAFNSDTGKALKVVIKKDEDKYTYNLKNDGTVESFPLQLGNGLYTVSVYENIEGNKYSQIIADVSEVSINNQNKVFLASTQNINWNENMLAVKKAHELVKNLKTDEEKTKAIYNYVIMNVKYDHTRLKSLKSNYLPVIDDTILAGSGVCYDYASLFAAMLRSVGIPAKLVMGNSKNADGYHAWNEVYLPESGIWQVIDTAHDAQVRIKNGKYEMIKKSSEYTKQLEY